MNLSQAQAEGGVGSTANEGGSGYWYGSGKLTDEMCINSCLNYGFTMAAIEP